MHFKSLTLVSMLLASGTASALGQSVGTPSLCAPADDRWALEMRGYVENLLTKPQFSAIRDLDGLPAVSYSEVQSVQAEELCSKAAIGMNSHRKEPLPSPRMVYVLKIGSVFWVEDPTYKAGEYTRVLVFDSTLTRIVGLPGR